MEPSWEKKELPDLISLLWQFHFFWCRKLSDGWSQWNDSSGKMCRAGKLHWSEPNWAFRWEPLVPKRKPSASTCRELSQPLRSSLSSQASPSRGQGLGNALPVDGHPKEHPNLYHVDSSYTWKKRFSTWHFSMAYLRTEARMPNLVLHREGWKRRKTPVSPRH